ncbi:hypothetical protein [Methylotuvimicrobium alcaliphilum]|uniref:hypothetical protein n=1 Tax=Methylotuvimicrobium alcaliphilum TaxID=271065 RepID=UPI00139246C3|nr:hypothetical protein [Methylotuvimicrobium alcaliphilum]
MQILQEQKSALPPTPVNRATDPPSRSVEVISCSILNKFLEAKNTIAYSPTHEISLLYYRQQFDKHRFRCCFFGAVQTDSSFSAAALAGTYFILLPRNT